MTSPVGFCHCDAQFPSLRARSVAARRLPMRPLDHRRPHRLAASARSVALAGRRRAARPSAPRPPAAAPPPRRASSSIGHGYGHGIGMGQWGSLGYALGADGGAGNFTYSQILTHYYGNTTLADAGHGPGTGVLHGGNVIVAMTENNGDDLIATGGLGHAHRRRASPAGATAVLFHLIGPGSTYRSSPSPGCAGPWRMALAAAASPSPRRRPPTADRWSCASRARASRCTDRSPRWPTPPGRRGRSTPSRWSSTWPTSRRRSRPSSWATLGGPGPQGQPWGFQQSEAQTVAARSYVESNPLGLRRLRRHLRPDVPVVSGDEVRDGHLGAGRARYGRAGHGDQRHLHGGHDRVLLVVGGLLHRGAVPGRGRCRATPSASAPRSATRTTTGR